MSKMPSTDDAWSATVRTNTRRLGLWAVAWVATMALANFGPRLVWGELGWLTALAIAANLAIGAGMVLANIRHLKGLDEMQQKVQLEAMGLSLGVGLVAGLAYSNLDVTGLIGFDAQISHLVILMGLTYIAGTMVGARKYR
ncbi:MAG: hypothetical protein P8X66_15675 [Maritimibacter sp.]